MGRPWLLLGHKPATHFVFESEQENPETVPVIFKIEIVQLCKDKQEF